MVLGTSENARVISPSKVEITHTSLRDVCATRGRRMTEGPISACVLCGQLEYYADRYIHSLLTVSRPRCRQTGIQYA